eukprot:gnl/MRDRNA2_/MRDRNA2_86431_c0_seq1.p1 gnl/MRDRNA2_/MRDRNA2_86431_c0~~gnl/MRDRNA2_/MRDRNA2_86431_c0_seq1.p1  ORF type:complete len:335 (+),score=5.15 gnl/MRDRNA2_/MRDRNA2_86431_c0_seq1:28-1032(+)
MLDNIQCRLKSYLKKTKNNMTYSDITIDNRWVCSAQDDIVTLGNYFKIRQPFSRSEDLQLRDFTQRIAAQSELSPKTSISNKIPLVDNKKTTTYWSKTTSTSAKYLDRKGLDMNMFCNYTVHDLQDIVSDEIFSSTTPALLCIGFLMEEVAQIRALLDYTGGFSFRVIPCFDENLRQTLSRTLKNSEPDWEELNKRHERISSPTGYRVVLLTRVSTEAKLAIQGLLTQSGLSSVYISTISDLGSSNEIMSNRINHFLQTMSNKEWDSLRKISITDRSLVELLKSKRDDDMFNLFQIDNNGSFPILNPVLLKEWIKNMKMYSCTTIIPVPIDSRL